MHDPFPKDWELVEVLGRPSVTDPDVPWFYNRLEFETQVADELIRIVLEQAYGELELEWKRGARLLASLHLKGLRSLRIRRERGTEALIVTHGKLDAEVVVQLKPEIQVFVH